MIEGISMAIATTAPRLKSGILPSISSYKSPAIVLTLPPTDAGIPKSVKLRKNDWIIDVASVPHNGLNTEILKFEKALSPISLDTSPNFLSIYPIVL